MDLLPAILESMRLSLIAIAGLVAFGFFSTTLMLLRQSKMIRDSEALLRETHELTIKTHELTAKAATALENVSRLVVHPGGRPPAPRP